MDEIDKPVCFHTHIGQSLSMAKRRIRHNDVKSNHSLEINDSFKLEMIIQSQTIHKENLIELYGELDRSTMILGDFPSHLVLDPTGWNIKRCRLFKHPLKLSKIQKAYSVPGNEWIYFISSIHNTFANVDHWLSHKANYRKYQRVTWRPHFLSTIQLI